MTEPSSQRMKSQARDEFERWAATYDESVLHHFMFQPSYRTFLGELLTWSRTRGQPFDLLDIGCGSGVLAALVAGSELPAGRIVGLDYAEQMCHVAAAKARQAGLDDRLSFVNADSEHLPVAAASFDVVCCSNSFHHYPHQSAVVAEIRRILRPGGRFMLIDGFRDNVIGWFVFDVCIGAVEKHVHHVPWRQCRDLFRQAGFDDIIQRKFNYWFPLLLTIGTVRAA